MTQLSSHAPLARAPADAPSERLARTGEGFSGGSHPSNLRIALQYLRAPQRSWLQHARRTSTGVCQDAVTLDSGASGWQVYRSWLCTRFAALDAPPLLLRAWRQVAQTSRRRTGPDLGAWDVFCGWLYVQAGQGASIFREIAEGFRGEAPRRPAVEQRLSRPSRAHLRAGPHRQTVWYDQHGPRNDDGERTSLPVSQRTWHSRCEGPLRPRLTGEAFSARLALLSERYRVGSEGWLEDWGSTQEVVSVPCLLWMDCERLLRHLGRPPPDQEESTFLLRQILRLDAAWEFTHCSASDGSRKKVNGLWQVGRASILHDGQRVVRLGGSMPEVEHNFDQHSYEAELEAVIDTGARVSVGDHPDARRAPCWLNVTDCLSGAQAALRFGRLSDGRRGQCYRDDRLHCIESHTQSMEAWVQVWVHSHGARFSYNEVADLYAERARAAQTMVPRVPVARSHLLLWIPEVKRSHGRWMLDALQVYSVQRCLERSQQTLRPGSETWTLFVNDPVRHHVLPTQEIYELLTDAQAGRIPGLHGEPLPGDAEQGRHAFRRFAQKRGCPCGRPQCPQTVEGALYVCGFCDVARGRLREGMLNFAAQVDQAYTLAPGWQAALALLSGESAIDAEGRAAARTFLLGLPHAPPRDARGQPLLDHVAARRLGTRVYARVAGLFLALEEGLRAAEKACPFIPRPVGWDRSPVRHAYRGSRRVWTWASIRQLTRSREWELREWCRKVFTALRVLTVARGPAQRAWMRDLRPVKVSIRASHPFDLPASWSVEQLAHLRASIRCSSTLRGDDLGTAVSRRLAQWLLELSETQARCQSARRLAWAEVEDQDPSRGWAECRGEVAGMAWAAQELQDAWRWDFSLPEVPSTAPLVRVWNGTSGPQVATRNWWALGALRAWHRRTVRTRLRALDGLRRDLACLLLVARGPTLTPPLSARARWRAARNLEAARQRRDSAPCVEALPEGLPPRSDFVRTDLRLTALLWDLARAKNSVTLSWPEVSDTADLCHIGDDELRAGICLFEQEGWIHLAPGWRFIRFVCHRDASLVGDAVCGPPNPTVGWLAWPLVRAYARRALPATLPAWTVGAEAALLDADLGRRRALRASCLLRSQGQQVSLETPGATRVPPLPPPGCVPIAPALRRAGEVSGPLTPSLLIHINPRGPSRKTRRRRCVATPALSRASVRQSTGRQARACAFSSARKKARSPMSHEEELRWHQRERTRKRRLDLDFESELQQDERSTGPWSVAARRMESDTREQRDIGRARQRELTRGERVAGARATRAGKRGLWCCERSRDEVIRIRSAAPLPPGPRASSVQQGSRQPQGSLRAHRLVQAALGRTLTRT